MSKPLQELQTALAEAEAKAGQASSAAGSPAEEVAQLRAEAETQQQEFGDLLACLGQESAKVAALQALLVEAGIDATAQLAQVCTPILLLACERHRCRVPNLCQSSWHFGSKHGRSCACLFWPAAEPYMQVCLSCAG